MKLEKFLKGLDESTTIGQQTIEDLIRSVKANAKLAPKLKTKILEKLQSDDGIMSALSFLIDFATNPAKFRAQSDKEEPEQDDLPEAPSEE